MPADNATARYAALERAIAAWALADPAVRAVVVVGSQARQANGPDAWSDLDLVVFTTDLARYTGSSDWLAAVGEPWLAVPERTGRGDPEWQALFPGGLKVDFVFTGCAGEPQTLAELLSASPYAFVVARGVRRLFDRLDPQGEQPLPSFAPEQPQPPTADEFAHRCGEFLMAWMRGVRFTLRSDLWRARETCDGALKRHLLTMLEWHALATRDPATDVWHDGRMLSEWADRAALADLPATFARYDAADLIRAMAATHRLFHRLARETASRWNVAYPDAADRAVAAWIREAIESTAL
ncbi:MAG: aminoglycoside 6-adenylyltransferase [Chloroflexi bacterium]|nr:aminoglycoside 6-adenylyltransferase [Chloroflexota bacterium]